MCHSNTFAVCCIYGSSDVILGRDHLEHLLSSSPRTQDRNCLSPIKCWRTNVNNCCWTTNERFLERATTNTRNAATLVVVEIDPIPNGFSFANRHSRCNISRERFYNNTRILEKGRKAAAAALLGMLIEKKGYVEEHSTWGVVAHGIHHHQFTLCGKERLERFARESR
jgi:hypothetical protein